LTPIGKRAGEVEGIGGCRSAHARVVVSDLARLHRAVSEQLSNCVERNPRTFDCRNATEPLLPHPKVLTRLSEVNDLTTARVEGGHDVVQGRNESVARTSDKVDSTTV